MKLLMRTILIIVISLSSIDLSYAAYFAKEKEALELIKKAADDICGTESIDGKSEVIELSGTSKANLSALIRKLIDLGFEGAIKYEKQEYQGVLQSEVARIVKSRQNCKHDIFKELKDVFFKKNVAEKKAMSSGTISQVKKHDKHVGADIKANPNGKNTFPTAETDNWKIQVFSLHRQGSNMIAEVIITSKLDRPVNGRLRYDKARCDLTYLVNTMGRCHQLVKSPLVNELYDFHPGIPRMFTMLFRGAGTVGSSYILKVSMRTPSARDVAIAVKDIVLK
jgi:hypothetical protein